MSDEMEAILRWRAKLAPPAPVVPLQPHRQCLNSKGDPKGRHRTPGEAGYAMKITKLRSGYVADPERPLGVYSCPLCGFWHFGRAPVPKPTEEPPSEPPQS